MIRTIILNGPPNSGKDVLGRRLANRFSFNRAEFKDELYTQSASYFKIHEDILIHLCTDRKTKEEPCELLHGLTPRGALIYVSEEIIKPLEGKAYFGAKLADKLTGTTVVTDGGFDAEVAPIIEASDYTLIVRIARDGCSFEGDSRGYISDGMIAVPGYNVDIIDFNNSGPLVSVSMRLMSEVSKKLLENNYK